MSKEILQNISLLKKYDVHSWDYNEYPHKEVWSNKKNGKAFREAIIDVYSKPDIAPSMLYLHIPFCEQLCYFCICSKEITKDYSRVHNYTRNYLLKEIEMIRDVFKECGKSPNFNEIYIGGGTPNYLNKEDFDAVLEKIAEFVDLKKIKQFTVESDPRRVDVDKLNFYHTRGVNKLSFGVQDFDPAVQKEINRIQPPELLHNLLIPEIREKFKSINFDILIGLPGQTPKTMRDTIEKVVDLKPDRIQFAYCHYRPVHRKYMTLMTRHQGLPDFYEQKAIFAEGVEAILDGGYVRTGFEHFATPEDPTTKALLNKGTIHYNAVGSVTGEYTGLIGLGSSGYSSVGEDYYFQNFYEQNLYRNSIDEGDLPVLRGYQLTEQDKICRDVINTIRTYFQISYKDIESKHNINFHKYFEKSISALDEFVRDGLVIIEENSLRLTSNGEHFSTLVASSFDPHRKTPLYNKDIKV